MKTHVYTLAYNLTTEVERAVKSLYDFNDRTFDHYIVDLGFPLLKGDEVPDDINEAKELNSDALLEICAKYKSIYIKQPNIGVSQNTGGIYRTIKPSDDDVLISCEPDEIQNEPNWVLALQRVLSADKTMGYCAPILTDAIPVLRNNRHIQKIVVDGINLYDMKDANINYGQIAYSCRFLNRMGGVPFLETMKIYGGLENALQLHLKQYKMRWGILTDFTTKHTNNGKLYREWKDYIIIRNHDKEQITFEEFLELKKQGNA